MPDPKQVFDDPQRFLPFLTAAKDDDFEGQFFDRKEACRPDANGAINKNHFDDLKGDVKECVSGFANTNVEGGLLVLGIAKDGKIKGIRHLSDDQRKSLLSLKQLLIGHAATCRSFICNDENGNETEIALIYTPFAERTLCETPGDSPKSWLREGPKNILMNDAQKDQIRREKGIVNFERDYCCPFDPADLDQAILKDFRDAYLKEAAYPQSDEEMLYQAGALIKHNGSFAFTNAGFLFFAANPQRLLDYAYLRLLRFEIELSDRNTRGLPSFEKKLSGSLARQIYAIRAFFRESGFFKLYQKRSASGGFIEEPEYPFIAIDEAIVNAIAHRDYAIHLPVECEAYNDAFQVHNPGRIRQRDRDVPKRFSLADTNLDHKPNNPKLLEWFKLLRDEQGAPFVKAVREGTLKMRRSMEELELPAPIYDTTSAQTTVTMYNKAREREARIRSGYVEQPTEFINLYAVEIDGEGAGGTSELAGEYRNHELTNSLKDALTSKGWYIDRIKFGRITAHRRGISIQLPAQVENVIRFFPAYSFQFRRYLNQTYLCVDYSLEVKNVLYLSALLDCFPIEEFIDRPVSVNVGEWQRGKILRAEKERSTVYLYEQQQEVRVDNNKILPSLSKSMVVLLLKNKRIEFDVNQAIKKHSLSNEKGASRSRFEKTQNTVELLAETIFPLKFSGISAQLRTTPTPLLRRRADHQSLVVYNLREPDVEFGHKQALADIREGITRFGSYSENEKVIEIVPICMQSLRGQMTQLIERLKNGKYKFRGTERTFHTRLTYNSIITVNSLAESQDECDRLLREHPDWVGNKEINRLFLVHVPEQDYALDDEHSPYYKIKRLLLEQGLPCQMIDTPTLYNPDWKDLNLALNITAKCGGTPWVLPKMIPDADFFIGLSYTQSTKQRGQERHMGYANVFDQFGKWAFYSGNTDTFSYEERATHFRTLVVKTLERLSLNETPSICFHYSAKFSREDRAAILSAARKVRPKGIYTFAWINNSHQIRLYDSRVETDGSLSRGAYVVTSPNQFYLSTTGYNPYRKALGTPHPLEVNVWVERPFDAPPSPPDLRSIAVQILCLTKLNWASTDSLCAEPITTKYAGDIAYLTSAFLRQGTPFKLHPTLEQTPWFI